MAGVRVEWLKWPDHPYRTTPMKLLGRDGLGTWLYAPAGAAAWYAATGDAPLPVNFLTLVPHGGRWWIVTWMWGNPAIDIAVYGDIVHPPTWMESCLRVVDLDLDVVLLRDGTLFLDDEDEFAEHSRSYGYPADVVARARKAGARLLEDIGGKAAPFGGEHEQWLAVVRRQSGAPGDV